MSFNFKLCVDETEEFRYFGIHMRWPDSGITIDQNDYVKSFEMPDMEIAHDLVMKHVLSPKGQVIFCTHVE